MDKAIIGFFAGMMIMFIIMILWLAHTGEKNTNMIIFERTQICKGLGGDEYHFWNDICEKIIQERKTKEIIMPNIGQN